jgi:hypothetical protein
MIPPYALAIAINRKFRGGMGGSDTTQAHIDS